MPCPIRAFMVLPTLPTIHPNLTKTVHLDSDVVRTKISIGHGAVYKLSFSNFTQVSSRDSVIVKSSL